MSIEQTGPQGYDYQYLQTVYLALLLWDRDELELIVEKKDGEDAEIHFTFDEENMTIETQVKSEQGTLGMESLAKWIGHFPDRQAVANLLSRLQSDPHRHALFITKSRCSDATQTFLKPIGNIQVLSKSPLDGRLADMFLEAYSKAYERTTPLQQSRDAFCKQQAQQLKADKTTLREMARRILIWERVDAPMIQAEVIRLMKLHHHIPEHTAPTVIPQLENAVKEARDDRENVIPLIRDILNMYAGNRAFSRRIHVPREDIPLLLGDLEQHHVLLLTGISFCGKSHMAEWIAEQLRAHQGFTYVKENQLDMAYRYLTTASSESRICFLEDPFGHTSLDQDATNSWGRLYSLIEQLAPHRKLIVTSRKDLLQSLNGSPSLETWSIGTNRWRDLTVNDPQFAINVWSEYSNMQHLPNSVRDIVTNGMVAEPSAVLQPGQIRHLAFSEQHQLTDKSFSELSSLAKVDSVQLGQSFQSRGPAELILLITMVLGCNIGFGIVEQDLIKLLQSVYDESNLPNGLSAAESFLEELERAGYIVHMDEKWMFAHPTYYEAAMYLVEKQSTFGKKRLRVIIQQLLSNEVFSVMLSCIRSLKRIYGAYPEEDFRREIRSMALQALSCPYPTIRDEALVLLTAQIDELPTEEVKVVLRYIETYSFTDYNLDWYDGIPKLKEEATEGYLWPRTSVEVDDISDEVFHAIAKRLQSPDESSKVIPEEAWRFARIVDEHELDAAVKLSLLKQLLTYKEGFIREAAAFSFLNEYGENPVHVNLVLSDPHPFVVLQGIQGCFQGWKHWSFDTRERVRERLEEVLKVKVNCVAAHEFMTKFFQKPEKFRLDWKHMSSEEQKELILLWGSLLPVFLDYIPSEFHDIDEGYLFESTRLAARQLTEDQIVRITKAWFEWVARTITHRRPSDFGMGFLNFLLDNTTGSIPFREHLVVQLLGHRDSYMVSMALSEYVIYWQELHAQEKSQVLALLQSVRSDVRWLKAIALTRDENPLEVCDLLLGNPAALVLPLAVTQLIERADTSLLTDAIKVYGSEPGELYNLTGVSREYSWPCIVLELLKRPEHPAFASALSYALRRVISTFADANFKERVLQACSHLCKNGPKSAVSQMTDIMLRWTVKVNGADSQALWEILYDNLNEEEEEEVTLKLAKVIDCISLNHDSPLELLGKRAFSRLLERHLTSDKMILMFEKLNCFEVDGIVTVLDTLFDVDPPQVLLSYEIVQYELQHRVDDEVLRLLSKVKTLRRQLIQTAFNKKSEFDKEEPLEGWVELWQENMS